MFYKWSRSVNVGICCILLSVWGLWSIHRRSPRISRLRRSIACHVRVVRCLLLELLLLELLLLLLHLQLLRLLLRICCCCWLLLLYSDCRCCLCCCGLALLSLDDVAVHHPLVPLCRLHEGVDDDGDSSVVDDIADCNPVLSSVPITCEDDPK